jgi:hypothetical protein
LALLALMLAAVTLWRHRMISANERTLGRFPRT